jgi:hypothetical protein
MGLIDALAGCGSFDWPILEIGLLGVALIPEVDRILPALWMRWSVYFVTIERSAGPLPDLNRLT